MNKIEKNVIEIDADKCIGCEQCANTCHQGAIAMVEGKAVVVSEEFCDGLARCLPGCPVDALKIVKKEVEVKPSVQSRPLAGGCPGGRSQSIFRENESAAVQETKDSRSTKQQSELTHWPVQLSLISTTAPYFDQADLLIAADCTAFSYANFHQEFLRGRVCLIGCPKLDAESYVSKLTEILALNQIKSVTLLRMEVPCCGGLLHQLEEALLHINKEIPWSYQTITLDGKLR